VKIEHFALNTKHAEAMTHWYRDYCGMPIWIEKHEPVYVAFLGEPPSLIEIYDNPKGNYIDLANQHPLALHLALFSDDLNADMTRLIEAGASHIEGEADEEGYGLIMLRDPWGLALQLCRRKDALVPDEQ